MKKITLNVNGRSCSTEIEPGASLLHVLRDNLELTGAKYGCGEAQCGACTVLVDGRAIRSCITPCESVATKAITTIEGIERNGRLHPVQQAFIDADAMQCGYCTTGMIMSGVSLLARNPNPTEAEIMSAMQGNICRCGTYPRIVQAIRRAASTTKTRKAGKTAKGAGRG